jgi:lysophospholipase L1-like esterase
MSRPRLHLVVILLAIVSAWASPVFAQTTGAAPPPVAGQVPAGAGPAGQPRPVVVIGPLAPVPPAVAMLRPDASELARINAALQALIDADRSPAQPLLKKYESLLMLQPLRLNTAATFTQTVQRMGPRHESFVDTAKAGNIDLLLLGDSITDWWVQGDANKAVFEKYFGDMRTANFGIAGDTTQGVLWGLHNGEGQGFQPKAVMLMIGTNNTTTHSAPEIAEGIGAVVQEVRTDFPDARILLLAIFPRANPGDAVRDKIVEINTLIAKLHDDNHVFYMDIGTKFLDEKGVFLPNAFRVDNLHPQALGYDIWGAAVQEKLAQLIKR